MTECFIYDTVRTPRGKGRKDGALHEVTALELGTQVAYIYWGVSGWLDTKEVPYIKKIQ